MQNDALVEICGLSFRHATDNVSERALALDGIDIIIRTGEFVGITGPSGCGKSTLCKCIAGLIPHAERGTMAGRVRVCGMDTREVSPGTLAQHVALTFQSPDDQLFSNSVEAEVAFGPEHHGLKATDIEARISWALEAADASHLRDRLVDELSGGEKQRIAIAAALALKPALLVLDEPTSELDPVAAESLIGTLQRLNRDYGVTILVIEHRLERLYGAMTRLIIMDRGKIAIDGTPDDVFGYDLSPFGIAVPSVTAFKRQFGAGPYTGKWLVKPHEDRHTRGRCAISVRDLEFTYPRAGARALDGVSLDFYCGEIAVIMGANGSGKTTLIKHFNGLLRPDKGTVTVDGESTARKTVAQTARKAGIVFQSPDRQLFAETVFDELAFGPRNAGIPADTIESAVRGVAKSIETQQLLARSPFTLSGGEKQRVAIGSVLTISPLALALDEPTLGLGHGMKERLAAILRSLASQGRAVIVVTHDVEFAAVHADRVIVISHGRVVADGDPRQVLASGDILSAASLVMPRAMSLGLSLGLAGILSIDEIVREGSD